MQARADVREKKLTQSTISVISRRSLIPMVSAVSKISKYFSDIGLLATNSIAESKEAYTF